MKPFRWLAFCLLSAGALNAAERGKVERLVLESRSVGRKLNVNVVLPPGYEEDRQSRYPVLYLLHGYGGNYTDWVRAVGVPSYAAELDLIVVMPDAGNSRYVNWSESEGDERNAWEDYIVEEVIGLVDRKYRTIARREGRAINGISMGGYGAVTLGLRHPDLFVSIASSSGSLASARRAAERLRSGERERVGRPSPEERERLALADPIIENESFDSQLERTPRGTIFATSMDASAHDPFRLITRVPKDALPHIFLDCGLQDRLYQDTRSFGEVLMRNDIPFGYLQLPGGHDAEYWIRAIGHSMAAQYEVMQRALGRRPRVRPRTR